MYVLWFMCVCMSITMCCQMLSGDASLIEINPFEFSSGNHTLTITFADEDGNVGSTEYSFVAQTREGK